MAEYIDRDMFLKIISHKPSSPTTDREDRLINGFISAVKNCPAADVRPVVRCRDCKRFGLAGCAIQIVDDTDKPSEDDFCSFGERKGGDE